ncbi:MAG TPA: response regulator [Acidobacteriaceae bacterium]|nr:response regulator [Acidobacteriaceae bacterium]
MLGSELLNIRLVDEFISQAAEAQACRAKSNRSEKERLKVLIVDDQRMIADTLAEILDQAGFRAIAAYDAWTALEVAAKERPEYLITDVLMPAMNGVDLAIAVTKMSRTTKILLFSGQTGIAKILHKAREEGYDFDLVAKPIHPEKVIERLKRL